MISNKIIIRQTILSVIIASMLILTVSCSGPRTKEAYLDDFNTFMENVADNYSHFNHKQWEKYDERYAKFTGKWYKKFQKEFTIYDEVKVNKLIVQYNYYKQKSNLLDLFELSNEDIETFKKEVQYKVRYYIENDMEEDLEILIEEAGKVSDTLVILINQTIKEYKQDK